LFRLFYEAFTGVGFIDYHMANGIVGTLSAKLLTVNGLLQLVESTIENLARLPQVLINPAGMLVTVASMGFYLSVTYRTQYARFFKFSVVFSIFFFAFLTLSGFFIPRHGSDFFPLLLPAAAIWLYNGYQQIQSRAIKFGLIAALIVIAIVSYTQPWLCASEFL
jgi:hypothetical protein